MSFSQAKDLDQDGELIAYVHNLLHVHKSGKLSYTTYQLQTSSTATVKAICFSPDKAKPLKSAMETKSPIKLRKYQFNQHFNNIVVNKHTVIQNYTKSLDFKPSGTLETQLLTINTINSISPQQLVSVKAKVTQLTGPKSQRTEKATLQKSSAVLVDPTGYIRVVFWEEWVNSVQENTTYIFKNLRVKEDNFDVLFLYKALNGHIDVDLSNYVQFFKESDHCMLRRKDDCTLKKNYARTNIFKHSYFNRIVDMWNSLPHSVRWAHSVEIFKKSVRDILIRSQ